MTMDLKAGYVCDRGLNPKRPVNQDRFLAIPDRGLFAVFDGVGGQRAGEVASQTAADTIEEALVNAAADGSSVETIRRAIDFANRDIFEMAESDPAYKTMATTVALIHIHGDRVTVAHVGDSRVYRLEDGRFTRETVDHTDLNDDIRAGRIGKEEAPALEARNVINRALGVENSVEVEVKSIAARDGARFLLCSDGIYRHMSDEEIARVLAENKDPQRAADELKRIVHRRGADDNLTAVVVQVGRARHAQILAIDDGLPEPRTKHEVSVKTAEASAARRVPARAGRIHVEFDRRRPEIDEPTPRLERQIAGETTEPTGSKASRRVMYTLLFLVLIVGAFYAGLRASEFVKLGSSNAEPNAADVFQTGREAFERGDHKTAAAEFESLAKREPLNARALYWLGRTQLEQRDYAAAAKSMEEAALLQPSMYDAYVWEAAAYEAMGEKAKAAAALARSAEERRKQPVPAPQ
ncbi:MAG TPA: protein phosphatase 2C domain-containing protein [Blastocatellia bacterium]|nr:protein phosphatase 2C domain-containing protein [Blastocatellia bacterium]